MCLLSISDHHIKCYYEASILQVGQVGFLQVGWPESLSEFGQFSWIMPKFCISSSINCVSSNGTIKKYEYGRPSLIRPYRLSPNYVYALIVSHAYFEFFIPESETLSKAYGQIWIPKILTQCPWPSFKTFLFLNSVADRLIRSKLLINNLQVIILSLWFFMSLDWVLLNYTETLQK